MNLLPRPRFVDVGERLTANRVASERIDTALPEEGYELRIDDDGAHVIAGDEAGLFYAGRRSPSWRASSTGRSRSA